MDFNKVHDAAIKFYGEEMQENQCIEECAELIQAINKKHRGKPHNIAEEIADVMICLEEVMRINDCFDEVEDVKKRKMYRIASRIGYTEGEDNGGWITGLL